MMNYKIDFVNNTLTMRRLSQVLCETPVWCFYSTPHRRFTQNLG